MVKRPSPARSVSVEPEEEDQPPGSRPIPTDIPAPANSALTPVKNNRIRASLAEVEHLQPVPASRSSSRSTVFRRRFFPQATAAEWNDWHWQLRNRIHDLAALERMLNLSDAEREALGHGNGHLPVAVTPYYASLLDPDDPAQALRRSVVPVPAELQTGPGEAEDPLGEEHDSPVPGLVHRYPDRVLFLVTEFCSVYCRYCTRSRMVGDHGCGTFDPGRWEKAVRYIERTPEVRDVLLSGGDPLTLSDEKLEWLLSRISRIPHVEIVRIGTKVPAVLPQRVTPKLARMLRHYHPLWMSLHFTHPDELTPEAGQACTRLADAGIPLGSQTVLLAGINDSVETMKGLVHGLLRFRVRPYYLYQCDPIQGSSHFRTPVSKGLEIIEGLRGHTTGYGVPHYVIDAPGGGGKIPLLPDYFAGTEGENVILRNYEKKTFLYPDTAGEGGEPRGETHPGEERKQEMCAYPDAAGEPGEPQRATRPGGETRRGTTVCPDTGGQEITH